MKRKIMRLVISCLMVLSVLLISCAPAVTEEEEAAPPEEEVVTEEEEVLPVTSTDRETLRSLIFEHDKLFGQAKKGTAKPTVTIDTDGYPVTRWNYHPNGAFDTVEKKRDDGHGWTTTAFRNRDPLITVHGRVHDRVGGGALRDAYEEIKRGDYDFTTNPVDVVFIRLFATEVEKMNTSTLQGMLANPTISTNDLAVMVGEGKYVGSGASLALVIGYTDTADPNDGNRIYACVIQRYSSGLPTKAYYYDDPNPTG